MNIKQLNIETVFSGVIHLAWLILLTLFILGKSPEIIINFITTMEPGTAALILALVFSVSFFVGRNTEHFISSLNYFRHNDEKRQVLANQFQGGHSVIWGNKIFSLSSFVGLLILGVMLYSMTKCGNEILAILVIGTILLTETVCSFLYWYYLGKRVPLNN